MPFAFASRLVCATFGVALPLAVLSKPIAFQDGWTVMAEHGTNTMREAQVFYAPKYWWSGGASYTKLIAEDRSFERETAGVQLNYLVKRWNLPAAQGNVFVWGGLRSARGFDAAGDYSGLAASHLGAQADYETRSIYASVKTDWLRSSRFSHRIDTVQLGVAPYEHDYEDLAAWFVVQARRYTGGILPGKTEVIPMLRLFKGNFWIEAGVDRERRAQAMVMMNF
jgi:hypothetical protein